MSEASGIMLLKLSQDLAKDLAQAQPPFAWEQMRALLQWTQTEAHFNAHPS